MKTFTFLLAFLFGVVSTAQTFPSNTLKFGNGAASDKTLIFNKGLGSTNPKVRWNNSTSTLQFSNDGTNYFDLGSGSGSGGTAGINILSNSDFETISVTNGWANSGGSLSAATSGSNLLFGARSAVFDAANSGEYYQSDLYTIPNGLVNRNCMAQIYYKGGDSNLELRVYDGSSNLVAYRTFESAATDAQKFATVFPCPSSGQLRLRVHALGNAAAVALDNTYLGEASLTDQSQATMYGSVLTPTTSLCSWSRVNVAFGGFSADTDCPTATTFANASAPATKIPGITFASLPPGEYLVVATGEFYCSVSNPNEICTFRFHDGTNASETSGIQGGNATGDIVPSTAMIGRFNYTTAQSNITIQLQAAAQTTSTAGIDASSNFNNFSIKVYRFPTTTEQVFRPDIVNWYVNANISGANPSMGTSTQTSYTEITDTGLSLTTNSGSSPVQIACASGTASTGSTCSSAESAGIVFTLPRAGAVEACATFTHRITLGASGVVDAYFQINETTNTSSTSIQSGNGRFGSSLSVSSTGQNKPVFLCGHFVFSSAGQKTLRLQYTQAITATVTTNDLLIDGSGTSAGNRDMHWFVRYVDQQTPAPLLVNSVVSPGAGVEKVARLSFGGATRGTNNCTSSPCTVHANPGTWVSSVTRGSAGIYTVNFTAGIFSSFPSCTCSAVNYPTNGNMACVAYAATTSNISVYANLLGVSGNTPTDSEIDVICLGPK